MSWLAIAVVLVAAGAAVVVYQGPRDPASEEGRELVVGHDVGAGSTRHVELNWTVGTAAYRIDLGVPATLLEHYRLLPFCVKVCRADAVAYEPFDDATLATAGTQLATQTPNVDERATAILALARLASSQENRHPILALINGSAPQGQAALAIDLARQAGLDAALRLPGAALEDVAIHGTAWHTTKGALGELAGDWTRVDGAAILGDLEATLTTLPDGRLKVAVIAGNLGGSPADIQITSTIAESKVLDCQETAAPHRFVFCEAILPSDSGRPVDTVARMGSQMVSLRTLQRGSPS